MNPPTPKRTVIRFSIAGAVVIAFALFLVGRYAKRDIGSDERCSGGQCWGFELSQPLISDDIDLRIWGSWGLNVAYRIPAGTIERNAGERWLGGDRAILLDLRWRPAARPNDSAVPIHILYDFQRGGMSVWSRLPLWRANDYRSGKADRNWTTETEFRAIVGGIEP